MRSSRVVAVGRILITAVCLQVASASSEELAFTAPQPVGGGSFGYRQPIAFGASRWITVWANGSTVQAAISSDPAAGWGAPFTIATWISPYLLTFAEIATDGSGNWVIAWTRHVGGGKYIMVSHSIDNGDNWSTPEEVYWDGGTFGKSEKSIAASSDGHWVLVWARQDSPPFPPVDTDVMFSYSSNAFTTWSTPAPIDSDSENETDEDGYPVVTAGADGVWLATWGRRISDPEIRTVRSLDHGEHWSTVSVLPVRPPPNSTSFGLPRPDLAVDGCGNWVLTYIEEFAVFPKTRIAVRRSSDAGANWSGIHQLVSGQNFEQFPKVATDRRGNWLTVWEGRSTEGFFTFASLSQNEGVDWETPMLFGEDVRHPDLAAEEGGQWTITFSGLDGQESRTTTTEIAQADDYCGSTDTAPATGGGGGGSGGCFFGPKSLLYPYSVVHWKWPGFGRPQTDSSKPKLECNNFAALCAPGHCPGDDPMDADMARAHGSWASEFRLLEAWSNAWSREGSLAPTAGEEIRNAMAKAPIGQVYTEKQRMAARSDLAAALRDDHHEGFDAAVLGVLNALAIDRLAPPLRSRKVAAGRKRVVDLDGLAVITLHDVARGGEIALTLENGLPADPVGLVPGWPAATYSIDFGGELAPDGYIELAIRVAMPGGPRRLQSTRIYEWDGAGYRNVTTGSDSKTRNVFGRTRRLAKYVVLQPGRPVRPAAAPERKPRRSWWSRLFRR